MSSATLFQELTQPTWSLGCQSSLGVNAGSSASEILRVASSGAQNLPVPPQESLPANVDEHLNMESHHQFVPAPDILDAKAAWDDLHSLLHPCHQAGGGYKHFQGDDVLQR